MTLAVPPALEYPFAALPPPGEAVAVGPGILWLRMPLPFALDHINVWLLADRDGWTLIDSGFGTEPTRALWETHFGSTLGGRPIARLIATHCHPDHVGNAEWLVARFGCALSMTHAEFMTVHAMAEQHSGYGVAHDHGPLSPARHGRRPPRRSWTGAAMRTAAACPRCRRASSGCSMAIA